MFLKTDAFLTEVHITPYRHEESNANNQFQGIKRLVFASGFSFHFGR